MSPIAITQGRGSIATAILLGALLVAGCDSRAGPAEPDVDHPTAADVEAARLAAEAPGTAAGAQGTAAGAQGAAAGARATLPRQLAALRGATARFHRISEAEDAGYTALVRHPISDAACLEHPELGAMGRHFLDPSLVDDEVSVLDPEVVIYEPGPNGELRLVGFEYLIPFGIRGREADPPVLFGQEFVQNETFELWALHVWAWKHNPSGMFADWNPNVSCEFDDRVEE